MVHYLKGLNMNTKELNSKQQEAASNHKGPLLILAGAGTGKTRTVTHRIASLIESGVDPEKILAITFTNKAATEMKERVGSLLGKHYSSDGFGYMAGRPFISTFHSLGAHILRKSFAEAGLKKGFAIADRNRSKQILKDSARKLGIDTQANDIGKVLGFISHRKSSLSNSDGPEGQDRYGNGIKVRLWKEYERTLREENSVDFDDLLIRPVELMESNKDIRKRYTAQWSHIHIDEYQDTNAVQNRLIDILAEKHGNICATGDLDQCIYSWRGALVDAILEFESKYKKAKVVVLEENYRSTKTILGAANRVISLNRKRKEKNLYTSNTEGERIAYTASTSETQEAISVAQNVSALVGSGVHRSSIAVLYRTNSQSRTLEEVFIKSSIPYSILGTKFLERQEVRDLLAYIELARNENSVSALKRAVNTPTRGIGKVTLLKILEDREEELSGRAQEKVESFRSILNDIREASERLKPSEFVRYTLKKSGLEGWYKERKEEERLENVGELISMASKHDALGAGDGVDAFLEDIALFSDQDTLPPEESDSVRFMTVHAAKGLEFDYVFITGLEEGLFPHQPIGNEDRDEEEERRLFYVALTRAKVKAFLSSAYMRTVFGKTSMQTPSRFITDIGEEYLETEDIFVSEEDESSSGLLSGPPLPPIY